MQIHNLGFPRIGAKRELKFSLEKYWRGELSQTDFLTECQDRRLKNWQIQQEAGVELLPVGDFAHYDHVLNTTLLLGLAPERFTTQQHNHSDATAHNLDNSVEQNTLDLEFRIGRGQAPSGCECAASDMTKWFNTNYHYIVPELSAVLLAKGTTVNTDNLLAHFTEAQVITDNRKAVLLGPITYLHLSVTGKEDKLAL
ncbi:MAG: 5-methyltetrahydropteroyltriglutamate--homocysteine S-methyltransferase, partial [Colwellia sp.]